MTRAAAKARSLLPLLEREADPAILLSPSYEILAANAAYEAHYGRSVEPGRDRCYRVSHGYDSPCDRNGESCPLALARETLRPARVFHVHQGPDGPEHVDVSLTPIVENGDIVAFVETVRPIPEASAAAEGTFVGRSPAFGRVVEMIRRVAPSETAVLLLGESGTGKELAARAIHDASARRDGPFVPVECSGLTESLFESELFGHRRGAFTGASEDKHGLIEAAARGTLFLDEIGDVPISLQVKLLRVLETGSYRRVGDSQPREADVRLVCATHRELERMMAEGSFRSDLYYRISAFPIRLPPLRERGADVRLLAEALLRARHVDKQLTPAALRTLERYRFPGNVRELRNVLERASLLADGDRIGVEHLPAHVRAAVEAPDEVPERPGERWPWGDRVLMLDEVEKRYLRWAEERFGGDRRALAARLGLSERTLYRRLRAARKKRK